MKRKFNKLLVVIIIIMLTTSCGVGNLKANSKISSNTSSYTDIISNNSGITDINSNKSGKESISKSTVNTSVSNNSNNNSSSSNSEILNPYLQIPKFIPYYNELKNADYRLDVRESGGQWESIIPYNVRINPNVHQNINYYDNVKNSPMIYFGMGKKEIEVRIQKPGETIFTAVVHPLSYNINTKVSDGVATFTLKEPMNVCVEINGDRYDMVYVFANPVDTYIPEEDSANLNVIKPGLYKCPKVGTEGWDGAIRDVRIYDRVLSQSEIDSLKNGINITRYSSRWCLETDLKNEKNKNENSYTYGKPEFVNGYKGISGGSLVFNGYEDALVTGNILNCDSNFTLSTWVYLDPEKAAAKRTILSYFLFVNSNGTVGSNIGDWQFPYTSTNKLSPGNWHNVILKKQGNEVTVYIDGVSGGSMTRPGDQSEVGILIGANSVINGLYVRDNETLFISPGAVLRGTVLSYASKNVKIKGSGVIDLPQNSNSSGILIAFSDMVEVNGVIVNNPQIFNLAVGQSKNVSIKNFKCFSSYGPSDGINNKASQNVTIDGCFLRTNDDAISIYATSVSYLGSASNFNINNSTLIADVAHNIMIGIHGQEYGNDTISNINVNNIDIVDSKSQSSDYQGVFAINVGNDVTARDFVFNNIRIENIMNNQLFNLRVRYNPSYNKTPGKCIRNITFSNITYNGKTPLQSIIGGYNSERNIEDVKFHNILINGVKLTRNNRNIKIIDYANNITFS